MVKVGDSIKFIHNSILGDSKSNSPNNCYLGTIAHIISCHDYGVICEFSDGKNLALFTSEYEVYSTIDQLLLFEL